ncbi:hypothetical protein HMPREF9096_00777 [Haemophilus sp. oral taxon 851 str. F0397]|nr:hypothetical protein HMPREF9096_00777 [Haemophilus sp. oral taxon 851 str. F0397]
MLFILYYAISFNHKLRAKFRIFGRIRVRKMHFNTDLNWRVFLN